MTDSYFTALGRAADAPPDISKTNYLQTTPDLSEAVNKNIDEISKSWDAHYDQMIQIYQHIHKQKSPAENLLQVMKHGKEFKDEYEKWQAWYEPYRKTTNVISPRHEVLKDKYGMDSEEFRKGLLTILDDDPDVKKENEVESKRTLNRVKGNQVGYPNLKKDPQLGNAFLHGIAGIWDEEVDFAEDVKELENGLEGWYQKSDEGLKHHLPEFGYTDEGEPILKSVNEATEPEQKYELRARNLAWYVYLNQDVAKGRFGKYKKDFILKAHLKLETWKKKVMEDYTAASLELITDRNNRELYAKLEADPKEFITQILLHTNHPEFIDAKGNVNHKLVLDRYFEKVEDGIRNGEFANPETLVKALGEVEFQAFGHQKGKLVKIKHHWEKRFFKLNAVKNKYYETERLAKEAETKAKKNKDIIDLVKWAEDEARPSNEVQSKIKEFMSVWTIGDQEQLPVELKDLQYEGQEEDEVIIERLERIKLSRPLTRLDIKHLTKGTPQYEQYLKEVEAPLSVGAVLKGPGSYKWRDDFIKAQVAFNLKITVADVEGNPKGDVMKKKAELLYNEAYYAHKASDVTITNAQAHQEAVDQVTASLDLTKNPTVGDTPISTTDVDAVKIVNKAVANVAKNPDLLNQSKLLEGEEPYIELAAKYLDDYTNGRGGTAPNYYKSMAAKLGTSVPKLVRARLEGLGRIKEGEVVFPEEGKPGERLLVNPTAAKTMRVYNLNEDYEWMLDSSKSPAAIANGGYLSVSDKDGNYVNLEEVTQKPMEAITMGDVVNLIAGKYTGFGIYEIPSYDLIDILQTNGIPMDMIFDEDGQNFLYLAALRHKAQKAQRNTGIVTDYRRLVNIDKDLHDKFNELAGDLVKGKPWLDLNNLSPDVAKEFIRELTQ